MTKIEKLNTYASRMLVGLYSDSPSKTEYLQKFFNEANNGLHGQAVIAYNTERNKLINNRSFIKGKNVMMDIIEAIEAEAKKSPDLKRSLDLWMAKINKDYPRSAKKRAFLAKHGFVVSDNKVVPHPWYMKLRSKLSPFISPIISKITKNKSFKELISILNAKPVE